MAALLDAPVTVLSPIRMMVASPLQLILPLVIFTPLSTAVLPAGMVADDVPVITRSGTTTVTAQVAVTPLPSLAVAVMVAVPAPMAVTKLFVGDSKCRQ